MEKIERVPLEPTKEDERFVLEEEEEKKAQWSGFMWFCKFRRVSFSSVGKLMGDLWNGMSKSQQKKWNKLACRV